MTAGRVDPGEPWPRFHPTALRGVRVIKKFIPLSLSILADGTAEMDGVATFAEEDPMGKIKYMDLREFQNAGFLQEVNRQFFHPLGLALEVVCETDGTVSALGGIWDYRDDPEGMEFDASSIDREKIDRIELLRESKRAVRTARYGDIIQSPMPGPPRRDPR
jgi:hypothetical protein